MVFLVRLIILLIIVTFTVLLIRKAEGVPMRCTGGVINGGRCNNTERCVPLGIGTTGIVPVVFTRTVVFVPVALIKFSGMGSTDNFMHTLASRADF